MSASACRHCGSDENLFTLSHGTCYGDSRGDVLCGECRDRRRSGWLSLSSWNTGFHPRRHNFERTAGKAAS